MHECVLCFLFVFSFIQMALEGFDNLLVVSTLYSLVRKIEAENMFYITMQWKYQYLLALSIS